MDYDLHGHVGVRLIDPSPSDAAAVGRQLGLLQRRPLAREPDLRVRFVDRLHTPGLRYVEPPRSGFTEEGGFVVSGGGRSARARIPFETLGSASEIVCEHGIGSVPLLREAIRLAALRKGLVPLHASAFEYRGTGVLVSGWAHGGKTSALLAFTGRGAEFVGDDLVLLAGDGRRMFGIASPVELSPWQVRQIPRAWRRVGPARRLVVGGAERLDRLQRTVPTGRVGESRTARLLRAVIPPLERRLKVSVPAEVICPGVGSCATRPEKLFLMFAHEAAEIRVEPADPEETLQRMAQLARHEGQSLLSHYLAFRFALPGRSNEFLERAHELEVGLLRRALSGVEMYVVSHPRPVPLHRLFEAMEPACAARPLAAAGGLP